MPTQKKASPPLHQFLARIGAQRGSDAALSDARRLLAPNDYGRLIASILNRSAIANKAFPARVARNPLLLYHFKPPAPLRLKRELAWAAAFLERHIEYVVHFTQARQELDAAYLRGGWTQAEAILDELDAAAGHSYWSISRRITLLQASKGLDAQKQFVAQLREKASPNSVISYLAQRTSIRNEPAVTAMRFVDLVNRTLEESRIDPQLIALLQFHLVPSAASSEAGLSCVLAHGVKGSVIDYFDNFVTVLLRLVTADWPDLGAMARDYAISFGEVCREPRLTTITRRFDRLAASWRASTDDIRQMKATLTDEGSPQTVIAEFDTVPSPTGSIFGAAFAGASRLNSVRSGEATSHPGAVIVGAIQSVLRTAGTDSEAMNTLQKSALNFSGSPWAEVAQIVSVRESSYDPLGPQLPELDATLLSQPTPSPWLVRYSQNTSWLAAVEGAAVSLSDPITLAFVRSYSRLTPEVAAFAKGWREFVTAEIAYRQADFQSALGNSAELLNDGSPFRRHTAVRLTSNALLRMDRVPDCVRFIVEQYVFEGMPWTLFPFRFLSDVLTAADRETLAPDLALPVFYDLVARHAGPEDKAERAFASEDFLTAHGLRRPSELEKYADQFPTKLLIHYLRYVCIEAVLDASIEYSGSRDLAEERLAVCRLLLSLDSAHREVYEEEIRAIRRRLLIEERSREVEQSRVYVDIDGIRRVSTSRWLAPFLRYKSLAKLRTQPIDQGSLLRAVEQHITNSQTQSLNDLQLPKDEATAVLVELLSEIRDAFATSSEFGLDGYLSVRIRHGTLAGYLRRPLEAHQLLTRRSAATESYAPNEFWPDRMGLDGGRRSTLVERLGRFSKDFDSLVEIISSEWIRVRTTNHSKGMFDFNLPDQWAVLVVGVLQSDPTFPEFIDTVIGLHLRQLEVLLAAVRLRLTNEAKVKATGLLTTLQNDLESSSGVAARPIHDAIVAARTELQTAFDRVVEWFRLPSVSESFPVNIEDAAEVALSSIRTMHPNFNVTIRNEVPDVKVEMRGTQFQNFVFIFFTLFKNVIERSQLASPSAVLTITSRSSESSGSVERIEFTLINNVTPEAYSQDSLDRLERIRTDLREGRFQGSVTSEGGTGLHKVWNLLIADFTAEPDLTFEFVRGPAFQVKFSLRFTVTG